MFPDTALLKNTSQLSTLNVIQAQGETEVWSPSMYFGLSTPPPQESAPTSIPQTPNSQVHYMSIIISKF